MENKNKIKVLPTNEKVDIIRELEKGSVSKNFGLFSLTVATISKNRESVLKVFEDNEINF